MEKLASLFLNLWPSTEYKLSVIMFRREIQSFVYKFIEPPVTAINY